MKGETTMTKTTIPRYNKHDLYSITLKQNKKGEIMFLLFRLCEKCEDPWVLNFVQSKLDSRSILEIFRIK